MGTPPELVDWEDAEDAFSRPARAAGDATGWFDRLYAAGAAGRITMPWSRTHPHPLLVEWASGRPAPAGGGRAVVVGCGLGADAELMASLGLRTTAFDVAPTAVRLAQERFPGSDVDYACADLLHLPAEWARAFDVVIEIITLQALPPELHAAAGAAVVDLVADGGTLLVIGAVPDDPVPDDPDDGPWPLTRVELDALAGDGLRLIRREVLTMPGADADRRWRVEYRRTGGPTRAGRP